MIVARLLLIIVYTYDILILLKLKENVDVVIVKLITGYDVYHK